MKKSKLISFCLLTILISLSVLPLISIGYTNANSGVKNNEVYRWNYRVNGVLDTRIRLDIENVSSYNTHLNITADLTMNLTKTINDDVLLHWNSTDGSFGNSSAYDGMLVYGGFLVIPLNGTVNRKLNLSVVDTYIESLAGYSSVSHTSTRIYYTTVLGEYESCYNSKGVLILGTLNDGIDIKTIRLVGRSIIPISDLVFLLIPIAIISLVIYNRKKLTKLIKN